MRCRLHLLRFGYTRRKGFNGAKHFLKRRGLVQGDPLSSFLCDIYYGEMVKEELWPALKPALKPQHARMLARGMDDFVFASTSKEEVSK